MDHQPTRRTDRRAHAAQAGLAALVAASLLAFSFIAFRTGLGGDVGAGVRARRPAASATRPVVLPASPRPGPAPAAVADNDVVPVTSEGAVDVVLGNEVRRGAPAPDLIAPDTSPAPAIAPSFSERNDRDVRGRWQRDASKAKLPKYKQTGHDKARGKGHHKNDHNGRHDTDTASRDTSRGAASKSGRSRGRGRPDEARPHQKSLRNEAGHRGRSHKRGSAANKSHKESRGKGPGKHAR